MDQLGYSVPASAISERLQRLGERRDVFVATDDGRVVGWAALFVDEPFVEGSGALLEGLVVDEAVRSRGIGIALLEAVRSPGTGTRLRPDSVQSNVLRERAHSFYERNGYAKVSAISTAQDTVTVKPQPTLERIGVSMRTAVLTALILGLVPIAAAAAPVAPEDLFKMTFLSNALISPDGAHVLVESSRMNGPKNTYDRTIDLVDVATGTLTHNVTNHVGDGDYDWMRDGEFRLRPALDKRSRNSIVIRSRAEPRPVDAHQGRRLEPRGLARRR